MLRRTRRLPFTLGISTISLVSEILSYWELLCQTKALSPAGYNGRLHHPKYTLRMYCLYFRAHYDFAWEIAPPGLPPSSQVYLLPFNVYSPLHGNNIGALSSSMSTRHYTVTTLACGHSLSDFQMGTIHWSSRQVYNVDPTRQLPSSIQAVP